MARVLVIDDSAVLRGMVRTLLERAGHEVLEAADGREGLQRVFTDRPDLLVLDVMMPELDGWRALERVRELSLEVPVLMTSGMGGETERVRGLLGGADDFLPKPFSGPELLARVTALLRRSKNAAPAQPAVEDGWARVDLARHEAVVGGEVLPLTPLEFRLFGVFVRHRGVALSHDQLLRLAWNDTLGGSRDQVKVAVAGLRRKLAGVDGGDGTIQTVRGVGYRYSPPDAAAAAASAEA